MAAKTVYSCDRCGREIVLPREFCKRPAVSVGTESVSGPSGLETSFQEMDLCHPCAVHLLQDCLDGMDHRQGTLWLAEARKKP